LRTLSVSAMEHRWCDNDGTRLHYLDTGARGDATPALVVPGWPEAADEYEWLAERLTERRVVIADLRGRGGSDAPATGYTWEHHIGDIAAIVAAAALDAAVLDAAVLVAFSRGSSYALGYALERPASVRGLVIGDYHARHVGLPREFVAVNEQMVVRGVPATDRVPRHVIERIQVESREVPLWDRLAELTFPVLLIRGGRRGALVDDDIEVRYRTARPGIRVERIDDAGHDLWSRDMDEYLAVLRPFLADCV
jgi:pimeloyl-ACP methyl ester carboxylesterase